MSDPRIFVIPNYSIEQISLATYEELLLGCDNQIVDASHPFGIQHCGSIDQVLEGYAKVGHLEFLEIGFGSDVKRARQLLGPEMAINTRIRTELIKKGTPEEVAAEVRSLIDQGAPPGELLHQHGRADVRDAGRECQAALRTAAEYREI